MVHLPGPGKVPEQRRGRSVTALLLVVGIVAALAACGQSDASSARISLLPYPVAKSNAWDWTAECRVGPATPTGCAAKAPDLGPAQVAGNEWNLGGGAATTGSVSMSVNSSGGLALKGDLPSAPPCTDSSCLAPQANTWVRGFPSLLYGIDQCNADTSPPQSPELQLPMKVASIPSSLVGSATYNSQASQVTYDVAYDMWLNASDTTTPCKTDGTLEVMVWTDYNAQALLPDSLKVGTVTIPFAVNGSKNSGNQMWSVYVSNVYGSGHTVPWGGTVWLVLDSAHTVKQGSVNVDLSAALGSVGTLLQNNYGWSDFASNYWLDTVAFGMEFGPQNADPYGAGPTNFSMDLSAYCVGVGTTVAGAGC